MSDVSKRISHQKPPVTAKPLRIARRMDLNTWPSVGQARETEFAKREEPRCFCFEIMFACNLI